MEIREVEEGGVIMLDVDGQRASQSKNVLDLLSKLSYEGFGLIVEVGTYKGGLTLLLRKYFPDIDIISFDIHETENTRSLLSSYGVDYLIEDPFESQHLVARLKTEEKILFLCDGGHKVNEFTYFPKYLKEGDFIGCHDYFDNPEDHKGIWTTCEIWREQIQHTIDQYQMADRYQDAAKRAAWGIFEVKAPRKMHDGKIYERLNR